MREILNVKQTQNLLRWVSLPEPLRQAAHDAEEFENSAATADPSLLSRTPASLGKMLMARLGVRPEERLTGHYAFGVNFRVAGPDGIVSQRIPVGDGLTLREQRSLK